MQLLPAFRFLDVVSGCIVQSFHLNRGGHTDHQPTRVARRVNAPNLIQTLARWSTSFHLEPLFAKTKEWYPVVYGSSDLLRLP